MAGHLLPVSSTKCNSDFTLGTRLVVGGVTAYVVVTSPIGDRAVARVDQPVDDGVTREDQASPRGRAATCALKEIGHDTREGFPFPTVTVGRGTVTVNDGGTDIRYAIDDECRIEQDELLPPGLPIPFVTVSELSRPQAVPAIAKRNAIVVDHAIQHEPDRRAQLANRLESLKRDIDTVGEEATDHAVCLEKKTVDLTRALLDVNDLSSDHTMLSRALANTKAILRDKLAATDAVYDHAAKLLTALDHKLRTPSQ